MRRDPSLHIRLSDLQIVLSSLGYKDPAGMADKILEKAHPYRITNRYVVQAKAKATKQITRAIQAGSIPVEYFEGLLSQERLAANHRAVKTIRSSSPEYLVLKEVAQLAYDFVEYYDIQPPEAGYRAYISMGLKLMGKKFSIPRFKTYNAKIGQKYEAYYAINADTDKEGTDAFHQHWQAAMKRYAGLEEDLSRDDEKYVCMLYGRQEADENDALYSDWIAAQFDGLAFLNAIPNPNQFFGENAANRYSEYIQKMNIKKKKVGGYSYRDAETKNNIEKFRANRAG